MSKRMWRGACSAVGFVGVMLAGAVAARAADDSELPEPEPEQAETSRGRQAVQLSLSGSLIDYQKQTLTPGAAADDSPQPDSQEASSTSYTLAGPGVGMGVGYAWAQLLIGARVQLGSTMVSRFSGAEAKSSTISFVPRVEYMVGGESARPFAAALFAIDHSSSSQPVAGSDGSGTLEDSSTRLGIGAALGIHGFLNQAVSLDPELSVMYSEGSGSAKVSGGGFTPTSQDYSLSTIRVLFSLGLSGWIDTGGAPPAPPPRSEGPAPAAPAAPAGPAASAAPAATVAPTEPEPGAEPGTPMGALPAAPGRSPNEEPKGAR